MKTRKRLALIAVLALNFVILAVVPATAQEAVGETPLMLFTQTIDGEPIGSEVGTPVIMTAPPDVSVIAAQGTTACWTASARNTSIVGTITLPVGATITGVTVHWYDISDVADNLFALWSTKPGQTAQEIGWAWSSGSAGLGSSPMVTGGYPYLAAHYVEAGEVIEISSIYPAEAGDPDLTGICSVEVTYVPVPVSMLEQLRQYILDDPDDPLTSQIDAEMETSLLAKVNSALAALTRGNENDAKVAMNDLKALVNQVNAQTEKKITPEAAAAIIAKANAIIAALGG